MFYKKYVDLCKSINKSPSTVAKEIGMGNSATTPWKHGGIPHDRNIIKICDYFGLPHDYFDEDKETPAQVEGERSDAWRIIQGLDEVRYQRALAYLQGIADSQAAGEDAQSQAGK